MHMDIKNSPEATHIMEQRFGCDRLISLATVDGNHMPQVRTVNAYYEDGSFYVITHALSGKMKQIELNPHVAICAEWFTAHGTGENIGYILQPNNIDMINKLRTVFAEWYDNGHTDEKDINTIILRIRLTDGVLFSKGTRYDLEF